MADKCTYNGWTNYATWRINLEIFDDSGEWIAEDVGPFDGLSALADYLQESAEEAIAASVDYQTDTLAYSYAEAFLGEVSWYEIASSMADDYPHIIDDDN